MIYYRAAYNYIAGCSFFYLLYAGTLNKHHAISHATLVKEYHQLFNLNSSRCGPAYARPA
jgi:hypothetical protein